MDKCIPSKPEVNISGVILVFLMLLAISVIGSSQAVASNETRGVANKDPGSDLWRNVRQRNSDIEGISQVKSIDSGILINPQAEKWTEFRTGPLNDYGLIVLALFVLVILVFYVFRGGVRIQGGLSGRMLFRFGDFERVLHWVLALVFLFLAVTGFTLLFGRTLLIPVIGHDLFSLLASSSKEAHNLFGPIFFVSLILMIVSFARRNLYAKGDLTWLLKGGGMIGSSHVSAGFFNMGEKIWYWLVILAGLVISLSGLILVSPSLGQGRVVMELAHVVHSIAAIGLCAISFGHIYLATVGTEGTGEGMKTGYVDINWAKAHHSRWARECHDQDKIISAENYAKLQGKNLAETSTSSVTDEVELKS